MMCFRCRGKRMIIVEQLPVVGNGLFIPVFDTCDLCNGKGFLNNDKEEEKSPRKFGE